ncbi:MAG: CBS domain-containing protein [Christensenellaceae bacterium]|jgi:predicted transcriptional regulator|nr:CBS domain-containing protein [Christensenellaceae bacterium]
MEDTNAIKFKVAYQRLEYLARDFYGCRDNEGFIPELKRQYRSFTQQFDLCKDIRNLLDHKGLAVGGFAVDPSDAIIKFLNDFCDYFERADKIDKIWIPRQKVFSAVLEDNVKSVMQVMKDNAHTHIPVFENNALIGIFSETVLFDYFFNEGIIEINDKTTLKDFSKYLPLTNHSTEVFAFISKHKSPYELKNLFEQSFSHNKRLAMVFVTENGKETESILGIVTAYDILGKE